MILAYDDLGRPAISNIKSFKAFAQSLFSFIKIKKIRQGFGFQISTPRGLPKEAVREKSEEIICEIY